jgi:pimeloyl-ACP methyl ester carboxylesterase
MQPKTPIYLISGLGADERIFQNIDFENIHTHKSLHFAAPNGFQAIHIRWIAPEKGETIAQYARRLSAQITTENPIVLGVSFGGIMAAEIAKQQQCAYIVLLSTVKIRAEIPLLYRFLGALKLHKILPMALYKYANPVTNWFFGMKTGSEKTLLKNILHDTDTAFLAWAIDAVLNWQNQTLPEKYMHFHGTNDHIFPIKNLKTPHIAVEDGGHLMVFNKKFL